MVSSSSMRLLDAARRAVGLTTDQLWVDYFALGGALSKERITDALHGGVDVADGEYNVLAHALNERFETLERNHPVHYRGEDRALPELNL
jgi:hypothetical protein